MPPLNQLTTSQSNQIMVVESRNLAFRLTASKAEKGALSDSGDVRALWQRHIRTSLTAHLAPIFLCVFF
jgi:hypothetical protein